VGLWLPAESVWCAGAAMFVVAVPGQIADVLRVLDEAAG
jgi:hypothetical protein